MNRPPNVVFIFADEWRAQAAGYNGDPNCETPILDDLASRSIDVTLAVSGCSICCPYRGSLMTGQYPLTSGVYINDVELDPASYSIARAFNDGGYNTAYIGKWHLYGSPDGQYGRRQTYVPRDYQLGFTYWKGFECNHDYNDSWYFYNDDPTPRRWQGYDAFAQSRDAANYIHNHAQDERPFLLMLSWGPPHFPLHTAPEAYRQRYADRPIALRPNVPLENREKATKALRGYYAHIAALDDCLEIVWEAIREAGVEENTIFIVTADHGDMLECQAVQTKGYPWEESIRVPFLLRWPQLHGNEGLKLPLPIDAPDIMPTLLGLCGLPIPDAVQGRDWSPYFRDECQPDGSEAALLNLAAVSWELLINEIQPYRGLRTMRYTYVRNLDGPWLLYDNDTDPYQMRNLIDDPAQKTLLTELESRLQQRLDELGDEFLDGRIYLERDGLTHYREVNKAEVEKVWRLWAQKGGG
ncbi:MAG: sulfatase [Chloroflexi bacterium]|nr:sulfatase [Chloroflexota bacterium]